MRLALAAALCLALVTPAAAEQWQHEDGSTPTAWFDNGAAQFQFACRGGSLAMGFWVRKPAASVAGADAFSIAITPDPAPGSVLSQSADTSFAQDMPLIHLDGSAVIVRGPVARQWARIAQNARENIRVAFVRTTGSGVEEIDGRLFEEAGAKAVLDIVPVARLQDDVVDPGKPQKPAQEQARGSGPDDGDLSVRFHGDPLRLRRISAAAA